MLAHAPATATALPTGLVEALVAAAHGAPSGDNRQPWRFTVDRACGTIAISVDPRRDPSPMNAGQRMARIACGAAIENLVRAAAAYGCAVEVAERDDGADIRLGAPTTAPARDAHPIAHRVTNRRPYDGRPIGPRQTWAVAAAVAAGRARAHWIVRRRRLPALARLIGRGDGLLFAQRAMRDAFLREVRFDLPALAAADEGLSLGCLEVGGVAAAALRAMRAAPDALVRLGGGPLVFARCARRLVESASGLCVIDAAGSAATDDLAVGRALQQAWLAIAGIGAYAQPMMSLVVLANAVDHAAETVGPALAGRVGALLGELGELVPELAGRRPAALLRFGFCAAPSARTARRPLGAVLAD